MALYSQDKVNLHTHSWYCGHGKGEISDYVKQAKAEGKLSVLGFSEHCPVPDDRWSSTRMAYEKLPSYVADVRKASAEELRGADGSRADGASLKVLLGAECDYMPEYYSYYKDELLGRQGFDYLIGAVHFHHDPITGAYIYPNKIPDYTPFLGEYVKNYVNTIESGLFLLCAHPDLYAYNTPWSVELKAAAKDIIQCALEHNMPLEVNCYGLRKGQVLIGGQMRYHYTIREFWEMALEAGVKICCNSDAHKPVHLSNEPGLEFGKELGIEFVKWDVQTRADGGHSIKFV